MANEKALRTVVAALLSSDLTVAELRRLAKDIEAPEFVGAIRRILSQVVELGNIDRPSSSSLEADDFEELYDFAQRKKIPKSVLRQVMQTIDSDFSRYSDSVTIRELITDFVSRGRNRPRHFINSFSNMSKDDPYLRGLIDRAGQ